MSFVLLRVNSVVCLCGDVTEIAEPYLRTNEQNCKLGRTQDHLSINDMTTKQDRVHNNNDDDDDGVNASDAAVIEERVKVCGLV